MFDMIQPCATCPFRKGKGSLFRLPLARLMEIFNATSFQCHKTVDYDGPETTEDGETIPRAGDKPQECAGLMAVLHRDQRPHQMMRIAQRCGMFDPSKLDPKNEAYSSMVEAIQAHRGREPK